LKCLHGEEAAQGRGDSGVVGLLGELACRRQVMTAQHTQPIGQGNPLLLTLFRSSSALNKVGSFSPAGKWHIELYPELC